MAIVESLKKAVDFVMDGFRGEDDPFDDINNEYDEYEEYFDNYIRVGRSNTGQLSDNVIRLVDEFSMKRIVIAPRLFMSYEGS